MLAVYACTWPHPALHPRALHHLQVLLRRSLQMLVPETLMTDGNYEICTKAVKGS